MNSKDIADLVEKRHDNVKRTIESLVTSGVISKPQIEDGEKAANGVIEKVYLVNKRDSYVLVAQLSPEFTARLVDRWQDLEQVALLAPKFSVPTTLSGALRLAADQAETIEQQAIQLRAAAPAVAFVERYVESDTGSMGFRQVCKLLKVKEPEFRAFLHDKQIMYKLGGDWAPYAAHIDAGRFEVKTGTSNEHAYTQAKFTAKGVKWAAGEWAKYQLEAA